MSTVFDVDTLLVGSLPTISLGTSITNITISNVTTVPNIDIQAPQIIESIDIEVPGIQGPPGVQNVYVQTNDPAVEFGWGVEETNYIWIQPL